MTALEQKHANVPSMAAAASGTKIEDEYWDDDRYEAIDLAVRTALRPFPDLLLDVTRPPYAALIRLETEVYAYGNEAGDPADTESPLVYAARQVWFYGDAIKAAVNDCHDAGGGTVLVPAHASLNADGAYYSGAIHLRSGVELRIAEDAVIKFMRNRSNAFYPVVPTSYEGSDLYSFSPFVYALGQEDIALTGGGTLDGQEDMWNWRPWKKGYWGELCVQETSAAAPFGCLGVLLDMNLHDIPLTKRIFTDDGDLPDFLPALVDGQVTTVKPDHDTPARASRFRPSFIQPMHCTNVLIEDIKIRNVPFWIVHPVSSSNILIRGIDIYSNKTLDFESEGWNNDDGIDPESCQNVIIENCHVTVSDDGIAIKAGRDRDGRLRRSPSDGIIVRHCTFGNDGGFSAAVSIGSEMSAGVSDVFIHDVVFTGPGLVLGMKLKTNSTRGGAIENIYLRDSTLEQAELGLIQFEADYGINPPIKGTDIFDPVIRNIYIDNVNTLPSMTRGKTTFVVPSSAPRSPVSHVRYRNSTFYTSSALEAGLGDNSFLHDLSVADITFIDPDTASTRSYTSSPITLLRPVMARMKDGRLVELAPAGPAQSAPNLLPEETFIIEGTLDLASRPDFHATGRVQVFMDRSRESEPVQVHEDGTFRTGWITLDSTQWWFIDRNYLSIRVVDGPDMDTLVFHVQDKPQVSPPPV